MKASKVALLMGSDSDLARLKDALVIFEKFGIECETRVLSAHRTPAELRAFVEAAEKGGFGCLLAAAGGAAHLAGTVAAHTRLPVLGIPMDNPPLGGLDALLSTVQMPGGIPVATFGVGAGGATNAALFAVRVLALQDEGLRRKLEHYYQEMQTKVRSKDEKVRNDSSIKPKR